MRIKVLLAAAALAPILTAIPGATTVAAAKTCAYPPQKSKLTLDVSQSKVNKHQKISAFGSLTEAQCVVAGATVHIYENGKAKKKATTDKNGFYSLTLRLSKTTALTSVFDGTNAADSAVSNTTTVKVK